MIRREIQLPGQSPQWYLTEQVEHARVSAMLADRCLVQLGQSTKTGGTLLPAMSCLLPSAMMSCLLPSAMMSCLLPSAMSTRDELLAAILHHDDGWAAWDAQPRLDAEHHRPPSFRELPLHTSLSIWSLSITAAESIGPLAAWVVSGHFLALLHAGDKPFGQLANDWQRAMIARRVTWLAQWQAIRRERNTRALADEALLWLQLLDVMSLWLCSACPGEGEQIRDAPKNYRVGQGQPLATEFDFEQGHVRIHPWRFDVSSFQLQANGWIVPIRKYGSAEELSVARVAHSVRWQLTTR